MGWLIKEVAGSLEWTEGTCGAWEYGKTRLGAYGADQAFLGYDPFPTPTTLGATTWHLPTKPLVNLHLGRDHGVKS